MESLKKSNPYFVRCIRSNGEQQSMTFDDALVMEQLKSSGMSETVRIKQSSYPIRIPHDQFKNQYSALLPKKCDSRSKIQRQLIDLGLLDGSFQVGRSLIFLKEESKKLLDDNLESAVIDKVILLQRNVRRMLSRRHRQSDLAELAECNRRKRAATIIQSYWRGYSALLIYEDIKIATITIQRWWRTQCIRDHYLKLQQAVVCIQCYARRYLARQELDNLKHARYRRLEQVKRQIKNENIAATIIQASWKGYLARQGFKEMVRSAIIIQRAYRHHQFQNQRTTKNISTEKFQTMKKIEAITPPPNFTPEAPDMLNTAFVFVNEDENLVVSNKLKQERKESRKDRKRRQSPETKWLIPEQLVEIKSDKTISFVDVKDNTISFVDGKTEKSVPTVEQDECDGGVGPVKPPTSHLTQQPYQVQLVRKETLRSKVTYPNPVRSRTSWMELEHMTPKVTAIEPVEERTEYTKERSPSVDGHDIMSRSFDEPDGPTVQSQKRDEKKSNRKHKRDLEKQMLKTQLPPSQLATSGSTEKVQKTPSTPVTEHRPPRPRSKTRRSSEDLGDSVLRSDR